MEGGRSFEALRQAAQDLNLLRNDKKNSAKHTPISATTIYDTNITEIESYEQTLIQHLRTAGIKKSRETELIDEVMHIRRLRRQLVAAMATNFDKINVEYEQICASSSLIEERNTAELRKIQQTHKEEVAHLKKKYKDLEKQFRSTAKEMTSKYESSLATQVESVKQKYEAKLLSLESMVQKVQHQDNAETTAKHLQEKYTAAMQRYKSAMRSLMDREAKLEQDLKDRLQHISTLEQDNKKLQKIMEDQLNEINALKNAVVDSRRHATQTDVKLQATIDKYAAENMQLHDDLRSLEHSHISALADMRERHACELNAIDDKVRQAMRAKDDIVLKLRTQLLDTENKLKQAEEFISGINRDLAPATRR